MKCPRCHAAMVFEKFYGSQGHFFGWRCIYCGEIVDQVILENRAWGKQYSQQAYSLFKGMRMMKPSCAPQRHIQ